MPGVASEVAALEQDIANSAASAQAAAESAALAAVAAEVLTEQVEQAQQAAAVAIVEEVRDTAREQAWQTERLTNLETSMQRVEATVAPLMATLEALTVSMALLVNNSPSAGSLPLEPATPNLPEGDVVDLPVAESALPLVRSEEAMSPSPAVPQKEKRHRML